MSSKEWLKKRGYGTFAFDDPSDAAEWIQQARDGICAAIREIRSEHFPSTETTNGRWEACPTCFPDTKRWPCAAGGAADDLEALL